MKKTYKWRKPDHSVVWADTAPEAGSMEIGEKNVFVCKEAGGVGDRKWIHLTGDNEFQLSVADGGSDFPIGVTLETGALDDNVEVATNGGTIVDGFSGLTPGSEYYLDQSTAGEMTATKPASGEVVFLGIAISATVFEVDVYLQHDAIEDDHSHTNKSELDLVSDGDHDVRTDNPHSVTAAQTGAAASSHAHNADDVNAGTLGAARLPAATESAQGALEIATQAETDTGTDDVKAVTPAKLANYSGLGGGGGGGLISHHQAVGTTDSPTMGSTSYQDLAEMSVTFTPTGATNLIRIAFNGSFSCSQKEASCYVAIFVDDVLEPSTERSDVSANGNENFSLNVEKWITLSAVSHTVKIKWKRQQNDFDAIGTNRIMMVQEYAAP